MSALKDALIGLTADLGIAADSEYNEVVNSLESFCRHYGYPLKADGLRKGILTVVASPASAYLLSYDKTTLLRGLNSQTQASISQIRVKIIEE